MTVVAIILFILVICMFIVSFSILHQAKKVSKENENKTLKNNVLLENILSKESQLKIIEQDAKQRLEEAKNLRLRHTDEQEKLEELLAKKQQELANIQVIIQEAKKNEAKLEEEFKLDSQAAAAQYFDILEQSYSKQEKEYQIKIQQIKNDIDSCKNELDQIRENRAAAQEAIRKEKQIKEDKSKYCLLPTIDELNDIKILNRIRKDLKKPRIICMLIWQTYWQPLAKKRFVEILGAKTKCGIYKITNQKTDECYIGQSLDIYKRWNDHCKCGLGIDAPVGNKLYKAMEEYGLEKFTFELLQECDKTELDERERYFISLYQSDKFGYNSTKGNK